MELGKAVVNRVTMTTKTAAPKPSVDRVCPSFRRVRADSNQ